jgi:hypothetical protein
MPPFLSVSFPSSTAFLRRPLISTVPLPLARYVFQPLLLPSLTPSVLPFEAFRFPSLTLIFPFLPAVPALLLPKPPWLPIFSVHVPPALPQSDLLPFKLQEGVEPFFTLPEELVRLSDQNHKFPK